MFTTFVPKAGAVAGAGDGPPMVAKAGGVKLLKIKGR